MSNIFVTKTTELDQIKSFNVLPLLKASSPMEPEPANMSRTRVVFVSKRPMLYNELNNASLT